VITELGLALVLLVRGAAIRSVALLRNVNPESPKDALTFNVAVG
jgi:hypothetical protein